MKKVVFRLRLLLFLILVSCIGIVSSSQAQSIPEGAARIDIKTDLPDSLLFERVVTLLQADGYSGKFRAEKTQIITDSKGIGLEDWTARIISLLAGNGVVRFRTEGNNKATQPPVVNEPLSNKGEAKEYNKTGFGRLDAFVRQLASSIPGSTVTYHTTP